MSKPQLSALLGDPALGTPSVRVVRALSERGALSATQIAAVTGLAKSTVSTALAGLRAAGMVVESLPTQKSRGQGAGRPATAVTLNPAAGTCVGVLLGEEHIQVILADVAHNVVADRAIELEADYSPEHALELAARLIDESYDENGLSQETMLGVGIAVAGPINPRDGRMLRASGVPTWAGVDIRLAFERALQRRVIAENESNCSAIAELMWGAAAGEEDFVFLTMDIAVGGAVVAKGQLVSGSAGAAGEFGHMCIDRAGELCRCGNRGCLELYAGFKGPLAKAARRFGRAVGMDDVIAFARGGDLECQAWIAGAADAAGYGLGIIGSVVNPGLVVVGGRLAPAGELLLRPLEASFQRHSLVKHGEVGPEARTRIVASRFSGHGACLGAVGLVLRDHRRSA